MAWTKKPLPAKVILGLSVIPVGFRLCKRLGSHEREITGMGREITFKHLKTAGLD